MRCPNLSPLVKLLVVVLVGWSATGCGNREGRFAISGKVSYDGQPVTQGNIGFVSEEADTNKSAGTDIVDGLYEILGHEGPLEGSYKVVIYAERPSGHKVQADEGSTEMIDQMEEYIPWIYNTRSTLTVDISGDRNDLDFVLEKPKPTKRKKRRRR